MHTSFGESSATDFTSLAYARLERMQFKPSSFLMRPNQSKRKKTNRPGELLALAIPFRWDAAVTDRTLLCLSALHPMDLGST